MSKITKEYKKLTHQAKPPIWTSDRARQIYLQAEIEESRQECKTELDYIRIHLLSKQLNYLSLTKNND